MNQEDVTTFVHKVMAIKAVTVGMGGASAGILGVSATGDQTTHDLKEKVITFASLLREGTAENDVMRSLAREIEGLLQTLVTVSVIDETICDTLATDLDSFLASYETRVV
jgi:hypothetical protein